MDGKELRLYHPKNDDAKIPNTFPSGVHLKQFEEILQKQAFRTLLLDHYGFFGERKTIRNDSIRLLECVAKDLTIRAKHCRGMLKGKVLKKTTSFWRNECIHHKSSKGTQKGNKADRHNQIQLLFTSPPLRKV